MSVTPGCFNGAVDLTCLTETIDRLVALDPSSYADTESVETLQRQLARVQAFVTSVTGAFDTSGNWAPDGARSAAAWLATRCRMPKGQARRELRRARALRRLPVCARAWLDGEINASHIDAFAGLCREATAGALERDEELLVDKARTLRHESFVRTLSYWEQLADPDGTEEDAQARHDRREVYLESSFDGMWLGRITLDPVSGAIVSGELERLERELFEADWAAARLELGREPTSAELGRSARQRRGDALVEMAARSRTAPRDGRRPAPLFSVFVGYETMHGRICELAQGTALSPGELVPWLDGAYLERAVFGPERRVEISAAARLFTGATRRAIELRDRQCAHLYCDMPASACEVDHIVAYAAGGPTTQENGRLLCGFHNRLRNQRPPPGQ